MKVIFLDVDGVLNSKKTPNPGKFPYIVDPILLSRLLELLRLTDAKIVLSSTWRLDPSAS
jgi:HAD domain in Swiss Army Knife RNA repair proteins